MAEHLSNQERKGGDGGQSLSQRSKIARYFSAFLIASGSYLNGSGKNSAMAQQPAERPQQADPQMVQSATRAVSLLRHYVFSGDLASRTEFLRVWSQNNQNEVFYNNVVDQIQADPEAFRNLVMAYKTSKGVWPMPDELMDAVANCHQELRKPQAERNIASLTSQYGTQFVSEMSRIVATSSVPVRIPAAIDNQTIETFLRVFNARRLDPSASTEDRMRALVDAVSRHFSTNFQDGERLTTAILHAYNLLGGEDRNPFTRWLQTVGQAERRSLAAIVAAAAASRQVRLPYELVRAEFEKWKGTEAARNQKIADLESEMRAYPAAIREGNLPRMAATFATAPSDFAIENMGRRLEYINKRIEMLKLRNGPADRQQIELLLSEKTSLMDWLSGLGIRADKLEDGLQKLAAGLFALQTHYYTMTPENPGVITYLAGVSANPSLYIIYRRYLAEVDGRTMNLFSDIDVNSSNYLARIGERISARITMERVNRGQAQWLNDYYNLVSLQPSSLAMSSAATAQVFNSASTLPPLAAVAFFDYLQTATNNGLTNQTEHRLVATTVGRLYAISPLLVLKYFSAIKNLATVCQDNTEAYNQALTVIAARISAQTDPIVSSMAPTQILPLNVRKLINSIDMSLGQIARIERAAIAQWDRLNVLDDRVVIQPYPPHSIEQRAPGYMPNLLMDPNQPPAMFPPYPFPQTLLTPVPVSPFTTGGVFTTPPTYSGSITLPLFNPLQVLTGAQTVGTTLNYYLHPQHPIVPISQYLPGVNITGLSMTKLLNEINRAFLPTQAPEYSKQIISGGGAGGISGTQQDGSWQVGGAGLGTLITPTGGASIGGGAGLGSVFGGLSAVAVPVAIPILGAPTPTQLASGQGGQRVTGLDSAIAGAQVLDDGTRTILLRAVQTMWDPNNPSQILLALDQNSSSTAGNYMTARYFYIDKQGTVFEVKGGQNTFVDVLNFAAGFANQQFNTPTTYAWDVEPSVQTGVDSQGLPTYGKRGGGVFAVDLGKTPILLHAQALPFFLPQGTPQPMLLQWTGAVATTVTGGTGGSRTDIYQVALPGKYMVLTPPPAGVPTFPTQPVQPATPGAPAPAPPNIYGQYVFQDVDLMFRRIQGTDAIEVRVGGGYGQTPSGPTGRGGFFIRTQSPKTRVGGGAFYEAMSSNFEAIALLQQASDMQAYIESLHRVGLTVYGSRETADRLVIGALANTIAQFKYDRQAGAKFDTIFYRFVGLIKALKNVGNLDMSDFGVRVDVSRYSGLDQMMIDYQNLGAQIGSNPTAAASMIQNFQNTYSTMLQQVFDKYFLGVQIKRDYSLEFYMISQEQSNYWTEQIPQQVAGRMLFTWNTGFWRAFAVVPLISSPTGYGIPSLASPPPQVQPSTQVGSGTGATAIPPLPPLGIVGTGIGTDLLDGVFMQRAAADVGLLLAQYELAPTTTSVLPPSPTLQPTLPQPALLKREGVFVQGAVRVFSNVRDDANRYRKLVSNYEGYLEKIGDGKTEDLPQPIRDLICRGLARGDFPPEIISQIRHGTHISLNQDQARQVKDALWREWFYDEKFNIEKEFNGHLRVFLAGSGYIYSDRTYWDIGTFIEYVDHFKGYLIAAGRDEVGLFGGFEVTHGRVRVAAMGGGTKSTFGAAASVGVKVGPRVMPMEAGISGYAHGSFVPNYTAPFYQFPPAQVNPEFGSMFFYTIGSTRGVPYLPQTPQYPSLTYNY